MFGMLCVLKRRLIVSEAALWLGARTEGLNEGREELTARPKH